MSICKDLNKFINSVLPLCEKTTSPSEFTVFIEELDEKYKKHKTKLSETEADIQMRPAWRMWRMVHSYKRRQYGYSMSFVDPKTGKGTNECFRCPDIMTFSALCYLRRFWYSWEAHARLRRGAFLHCSLHGLHV